LQKSYSCKDPQFIILYGRRRVGKTELALQFSKGKPHIYFLASETSEKDNLENLFERVYDFYKDDILSYERKWENLFKYLSRKKERLILIIDEFPYLVSQNKSLPSIFQKGWDLYLKKSKIFLLLSGSSVGIMQAYALDYKSPLYGRRTGQWKLNPLRFKDLKGFFPGYKVAERVAVYGAIGAIPAYLAKFSPKAGFWKNVENNLLSKGTFLYEEIDFLLKQELREPKVYKNILKSIALGNTKFGEIMNATGIDKSKLFVYVQ
jgi:AAA+ ATPase superfamily predicted ATPase